ncbi:MAG: InlB B-repeat-containing protein [Eubacteriales bacterium]
MRKSIFARRIASLLLSIVFLMSTVYLVGFQGALQAAASTVGIGASGYTPVFGGSSAVAVDSGITINTSDFASVKVSIVNRQSGDVLGYTGSLPGGVTGAWNSAAGTLTFTGSAAAAMWQELLRTVTFNTTSTFLVSRTITFALGSAVPFAGNGHYYKYISPYVTWTSARDSAAASRFLGLTGYLATITSAAENAFIQAKLTTSAWIGASDDHSIIRNSAGTLIYGNQNASEGKWYWVTGPEAGTLFSTGDNSPAAAEGRYMNWNGGEPNDFGTENYGQIYTGGQWNDISNNSTYSGINGYVVEYGGMTGDPTVQLSVSKTVSIVFDSFGINYNLDGGTNYFGAPSSYTKVSDTIVLGIPQKTGYSFIGWYDSALGGSLITQIAEGSSGEKNLFAGWNPSTGTTYKVEHYQQDVPGTGYALKDTDNLTGITASAVSAAAKVYTGFTLNTSHAGTITGGTIQADGSLVLKLYYNRVPVIVTFVDQGGAELKKDTVLYEGTATPPSDPARTGYRFSGWSGMYAGVTADQTVTASYAPNTDTEYKVEYYRQDVNGTVYVIKDTDYLKGTTASAVSAAAKSYTGFTLNPAHAGTVTGGTILADGSLVLKLYYNRDQVVVTFVDQGGAELKKDTVLYEGTATPPPDPMRTGYMFAGWSGTYAGVTADQTVTATYTPVTDTAYKVEHYRQDVAGTEYALKDTDYMTGVTDSSVSASAKSYSGFTLNPAHADTVADGTILADGSLVLKLYYNRVQVVVTFVDQDGAELKKDTVLYEGTATPPSDPARTGYTFGGWSGTFADVTSDQTVTAAYTPKSDTQYKVEHYQQAVAGTAYTLKDTDYLTGTTDTAVSAAAKSYTGFTLNTAQAGTKNNGTVLPDGSLVLKLYYDRNQATVTFEDYSGTGLTKEIVRYGGTATPVSDPARTGYMFAGWYKEEGGTNAWDFDTDTVSMDMTLFAKWTINIYTVTFQDWDGTVISSQLIVYGKDAIAPANPVRSGYTFTSWSMPFANITGNVAAIAGYSQNPVPTAAPSLIAAPTPVSDVLGANRAVTVTAAVTATPTAAAAAAVLSAAKTGETGNQNMMTAVLVLLAAFAAAGAVFVIRRKKMQD